MTVNEAPPRVNRPVSDPPVTVAETPRRGGAWVARLAFIGSAALFLGLMFTSHTPEVVGLSAIALLLVLMLAKIPVGVSMALPSLAGLYALLGNRAVENALSTVPYDATAQWTLSVLPMFVLMGFVLQRSGITSALYRAATLWLGWMPGGLGVATNVAGAGMSAVTGSSMATTYTLARAGLPEMLRRGYDRRIAVGAVGFASLSGNLIPPSILLVLFASAAAVPVGPQLMAGFIPGIVITLLTCAVVVTLGVIRPSLVGREKGRARDTVTVSWSERLKALANIWPLPLLMVVVLGTMYAGVFTATEAAAAGALMSVALTLVLCGRKGPRLVATAAAESVTTVGGIFFLLIGAALLNRLLTISGLVNGFTEWVASSGLSRLEFIGLLVVAYLVMGMFLESVTMMLLTVPVLMPIVDSMGMDPLWFGVFVVLMAEVGMLTPPVGILSFIMYGLTQEPEVNLGQRITLGDVFVSILWFMPAVVATLGVLVAWPELVTWLPARME